jgi:hypothetical protein
MVKNAASSMARGGFDSGCVSIELGSANSAARGKRKTRRGRGGFGKSVRCYLVLENRRRATMRLAAIHQATAFRCGATAFGFRTSLDIFENINARRVAMHAGRVNAGFARGTLSR